MAQDSPGFQKQETLPQIQPRYRRLFRHLRNLHRPAQLAVCVFMSALVNGDRVIALIDQIARERGRCPNCPGQRFYKHGFANGLQRYRCRACGATFNGLTGTPLARLRLKDRWLAYFDGLRDPACTVRTAAVKAGIHPNTSFRWRHRFLAWTKLDRADHLEGVAEVQRTSFPESEKGCRNLSRTARRHGGRVRKSGDAADIVNVVVARDRGGQTIDFVAGKGPLKATALRAHLLPVLQRDVILMSDGGKAYRAFARRAQISHQMIQVSHRSGAPASIHLDNVRACQYRFDDWLRHFNGVATRYLANYLGWRWAIDFRRIDTADRFLRAALGIFNSKR